MEKVEKIKLTNGLVAAAFTPFKSDMTINPDIIPEYVDYLLTQDVKGVYVNGTTGEGVSLTVPERKQMAEAWVRAGKDKLESVSIQVGGTNVNEAMDMAEHAQLIGADAISAKAPSYYKPKTIESLVRYCKEVAAKAPQIPFYYYHIPVMTGIHLNMEKFLMAAKDEVPTLRGLKFSSPDLVDCTQCVLIDGGRFHIMYGSDELSLASLALGVEDHIGSTYNFMAHVYHRMRKAFKDGKLVEARKEIYRSQGACKIIYKYGALTEHNTVPQKVMMEIISGLSLGPPRSPLKAFSNQLRQELERDLEQSGIFQWKEA